MLRLTHGVAEVRTWAQARGAWPCRQLDGGLALGFSNEPCRGVEIGWAEFAVNFRAGRCVLIWDDAPGSTRALVYSESEAHREVVDEVGSRRPLRPAPSAVAPSP